MPHKIVNGQKIELSAQEVAQRQAEEKAWQSGAFDRAMADLRQRRNRLIAQSDWRVIKARETGASLPQSFLDYRKALRDITEGVTTIEQINKIVMPTNPLD